LKCPKDIVKDAHRILFAIDLDEQFALSIVFDGERRCRPIEMLTFANHVRDVIFPPVEIVC